MKLKTYSIANFKAFRQPPQKVPIKPITLVFGPNSAGKSSLLHSMLWLNHAIKHDELNVRYPSAGNGSIDIGGFSQAVNDQASPSRVVVELELDRSAVPSSLARSLNIQESLSVEMSYGIYPTSPKPNDVTLLDLRIQIDGEDFLRLIRQKNELSIVYHDVNRHKSESDFPDDSNASDDSFLPPEAEKLIHLIEDSASYGSVDARRTVIEEIMLKLYGSLKTEGPQWLPNRISKNSESSSDGNSDKMFDTIDQLLRAIHDACKNDLGHLNYVPPLRELPERYFDATGAVEIWTRLFEQQNLLKKVNQWLSHEVFQSKYQLVVTEYLSRTALQESLPHAIRSEIVRSAIPDPIHEEGRTISSELVEVIEQLMDAYEAASPETILESFPWLKEDILRGAAADYWAENRNVRSSTENIPYDFSYDRARVWSDQNICLDEWVGLDALKNKEAFAIILFSLWAANQPQVLDVFNNTHLGDTEMSSREFLDQIASSKRDVRREIHLKEKHKGTTVSLQDVGAGISQVLPVIINAFGLKNEFIAIEQPEIHIHPALQAELGDVFIEAALGENKNTFLIETHSEHLILRILRRIRETTETGMDDWPEELKQACPNGIRPEDVAVLYVKPGAEGAEVIELPVTPDGDFSRPWPDGFFSERSNELF